jgi:hypothetical protein
MTSSPSSPFSDDELSADLDGEVAPDVHAAIEADPAAVARRGELARARAAVGAAAVPALDPSVVDDLVGRALDAADDGTVVPLPRAGAGRRGPAPWMVAAAVLLLMAAGLALIYTGRDQDQSAMTVGDDAPSALADEEAGAEGADGSRPADDLSAAELPQHGAAAPEAGIATTVDANDVGFLGAFDDPAALRTAAATQLVASTEAPPADATEPSVESLDRCDQQLRAVLETEATSIERGWALVDGDTVLVYGFERPAFSDGSPTTVVAAVGIAACEQVVLFER